MKRCPKCNRAESDDSLAFCRTDGTPLLSDGSFVSEGAGTLRFDSAPVTGETDARILPTGEGLSRPTAPTTVLGGRQPSGDTQESGKPKSLRVTLMAVAAVLAVALAASAYLYLSRGRSAIAKNSIAVLPFQNASGDPDVEYLSDGISESLINSLSQLPNVRVLARSTMFSFKGKEINPQEVGKQLGVETVLTGRVVQRGDSLSVQADLVNVADGSQMWGARYSRKMTDVLAVQDEIVRDVSRNLRARLSGADEQRLAKNYTANPEAYKLYLQGRFYWNKSTPANNRKAIEYFNQAIAVDPDYALAYAGIADAYPLLSFREPQEVMPKAREAALKALSLDNHLAEANVALGRVLLDYDYDFAAAERELKRATELDPDYVLGHAAYGMLFSRLGRHEEAFAEYRRALELEPLSLRVNRGYGEALFYARRYDEAIAQLKKTVELDASFLSAHISLRFAYQMKGNFAESIEEQIKAAELQGN